MVVKNGGQLQALPWGTDAKHSLDRKNTTKSEDTTKILKYQEKMKFRSSGIYVVYLKPPQTSSWCWMWFLFVFVIKCPPSSWECTAPDALLSNTISLRFLLPWALSLLHILYYLLKVLKQTGFFLFFPSLQFYIKTSFLYEITTYLKMQ